MSTNRLGSIYSTLLVFLCTILHSSQVDAKFVLNLCWTSAAFRLFSCAGTPWDSNLYEMMLNVVLPLWGTLAQEGLIDPDRYLSTKLPPENNTNAFLMIQARLDTYESQWSYLFDYMTPKQVLLSQVQAPCLSFSSDRCNNQLPQLFIAVVLAYQASTSLGMQADPCKAMAVVCTAGISRFSLKGGICTPLTSCLAL